MQHATNTQHDPADDQLDEQLRRHLVAGDDAEARADARRVAAHRLDDAIASEARRRSPRIRPARRRSIAAMVGGVAAALLVAGALVPGLGQDADRVIGAGPFVAADASAAEVLEQAARMLASGSQVGGSGSTWHSRSHGSGGMVWEAWYDADAQVARWAAYEPGGSPAPASPISSATQGTYYVLDAEGSGASSIRQYTQSTSGAWTPLPGSSQMDGAGPDVDLLGGATVEIEAIAWLRSVGSASGAAEVRSANERFVERTTMWFSPPMESTDPADVRSATRAMQALYLMRIARLEPAAAAQLYRDVADLETLERLDDGRADGRDVLRVRLFTPPTGLGGDTLETILLLDARTGAPVGTENDDASRRSSFVAPRRAAAIGDEPESCGDAPRPPCELLRGEGPIAAAADRTADRERVPLDPTPAPETGDRQVAINPAVAVE